MALAPVVAAALNVGLPTRPKGLYVDGLDILGNSGRTAYGVAIESIELTEAGPGQVSALSFVIDDPTLAVAAGLMTRVLLVDIARDVILFAGFVRSFAMTPLGVGRRIAVECVGLESVLDWMIVPAVNIAAGVDVYAAVGTMLGLATGIGVPIRLGTSPTPGNPTTLTSSVALGSSPSPLSYAVAFGGGSLRQALSAVLDSNLGIWPPGSGIVGWNLTVDFYGNLRCWYTASPFDMSSTDFGPLTISVAASRPPANLQHRTDMGSAARGAYVAGGAAAGSGLVGDGTGIPGPVALIRNTDSLVREDKLAIGQQYLTSRGATVGGTVECEENVNIGSVAAQVRPGSLVTITDAQAGLLAYTTPISEIRKRFYPSGAETWTIAYGSLETGTQLLRRLTRDRLS